MPVQHISAPGSTPPADQISSRSASMSRTDFLQMLTAQLRAQDPMNPMDGQNFASQLAQFSSLQELQSIGETMDKSLQANWLLAQTFNNTMAASFIGKNVRADVDQISLGQDGDVNMTYQLPSAATSITVEIKDADGKVIRSMHLNAQAAGEHSLAWDGLNENGGRAPAGNYTYAVTAADADGNAMQATTYMEGRVSEVRYVDGQAVLTVNGITVQLGQVISISDPVSGDESRKG